MRGKPCGHLDLVTPPIFRGVARKLAQWHAVLPSNGTSSTPSKEASIVANSETGPEKQDLEVIRPRRTGPSMWAVLQKWILALPVATPEQRSRRLSLQRELQWAAGQLDDGKGIGEDGVRPQRFQAHSRCIMINFLPSLFSRTAISYAPM